jgi:hypothetical protein
VNHLVRVIVLSAVALAVTSSSCRNEPRSASSGQDSVSVITNPDLQVELLAMARADQDLREGLTVERFQDSAFAAQMLESQERHAARVGEVLDEFGWPGKALVGTDGAEAAWLLVQHGDLELQVRALRLMRESADPGISEQSIAMLTDRVLVGQGKPQRYGTQFSVADGELVLDSLENRDSVEVWRARIGLGSLADYIEQVRAALDIASDSTS